MQNRVDVYKSCKLLSIISVILLMAACTAEPNIRGVPEKTWQQLTAEQKQLIVDQSYQQDIGNASPVKNKNN